MKNTKILWAIVLTAALGCSTSNNLRKFNDTDISKEVSDDLAKKFEVKDAGSAAKASPAPLATPIPEKGKKAAKKGKKDGKVEVTEKAPLQQPMRRPATLPFEMGEKLEYDIRYLGVTAGYLNIEVAGLKEVNSRKVYHLRGSAKTVKLFELVYRVDDSIESFWDFDGLYSHRFTMDLDESKQNRKLIELYDYEKKQCFYWDRLDHVEKGFSEKKETRDIVLWSQDILSSLFYIRTVDLPKDTSGEFRFPVILDGKPWESVIKFKEKGTIYANSHEYKANIYKIENYEKGELKNKDNTLWVSDDEHRYILRVEAKVRVGSFAVALEKVR